jgi:hypothetical protein
MPHRTVAGCISASQWGKASLATVVVTRPAMRPHSEEVVVAARPRACWQPPRAGGKGKWVDDPGGPGTEIVRELRACDDCAAKAAALERRHERSSIDDRTARPTMKSVA